MFDFNNWLTGLLETQTEGPPKPPSLPDGNDMTHNDPMEHRVTALETRLDTVLPTLATKADLGELRTEMHKGFGEMVKWIVGTGFVGLAAFVTIITFVLNNAVPKAPITLSPAPIIITMPAAVQPPAPGK